MYLMWIVKVIFGFWVKSLIAPEPECSFDNPPGKENKKFTLLKFQDINFGVENVLFWSLVLEYIYKNSRFDIMIISE